MSRRVDQRAGESHVYSVMFVIPTEVEESLVV